MCFEAFNQLTLIWFCENKAPRSFHGLSYPFSIFFLFNWSLYNNAPFSEHIVEYIFHYIPTRSYPHYIPIISYYIHIISPLPSCNQTWQLDCNQTCNWTSPIHAAYIEKNIELNVGFSSTTWNWLSKRTSQLFSQWYCNNFTLVIPFSDHIVGYIFHHIIFTYSLNMYIYIYIHIIPIIIPIIILMISL